MNKYGQAAIKAVKLYISNQVETPKNAWDQATVEIFGMGTSSQKTSCPKVAFLGLCEEGLIKGIPRGMYTRSKKNKKYALDAVRILKQNTASTITSVELWVQVVTEKDKKHNNQMDVVISLWSNHLIE